MFKGDAGRKNMLKIFGVVLACLLVLIIMKLTLFKDVTLNTTPATETVEIIDNTINVIANNNVKIPECDGEKYFIEINNGDTFFTAEEIAKEYFLTNSVLDEGGRPQTATACLDKAHLVFEENTEDLSKVKPSGWKEAGIYAKRNIIAWELSGSNVIENLFCAVEYLDKYLLPEYETKVIEYLAENPSNHVMYRATPYYKDYEKACRGILLEALSVEDEGKLEFCVFLYNAQSGTEISYSDGTYHMYYSLEEALGTPENVE